MKKVSVIIPAYNAEPYIEQCARSVLEQTLKDIEIIFIDCRQHRNFRHFEHSNFPDWKRHGFPAFWEKVLFKRN